MKRGTVFVLMKLLTASAAAVILARVTSSAAPAAPTASAATVLPATALLKIQAVPPNGLVLVPADLATLFGGATMDAGARVVLALTASAKGRPVPAQFVPDAGSRTKGMLVLRLPNTGIRSVELRRSPAAPPPATVGRERTVRTRHYVLSFDPAKQGGFPARIAFAKTGKAVENFVWNDRLFSPTLGQFWLRRDPQPRVQIVSEGAVCTVVRVRARYTGADGKRPPSQPEAVYDWYLFRDEPLAFVAARVRQPRPTSWGELHFLEFNVTDDTFRRFAGGAPVREAELAGSKQASPFDTWAALLSGTGDAAIGMFGAPSIVYDGRGEYGTYLHAHGPATWQGWSGTDARRSTWLWIGQDARPAEAVRAAARQSPQAARVVLTRADLDRQITGLRASAARQPGGTRQRTLWRVSLAERRQAQARLDEAARIARGPLPAGWSQHTAGDLGLALRRGADGVQVQSLFDLKNGEELLASNTPPLFTLTLRDTKSKEEVPLTADAGWRRVTLERSGGGVAVRWLQAADPRLQGVAVTARATADARTHAWRWTLAVENRSAAWSVWRVSFPQVALAEMGGNAKVLFPRGPGEVQAGLWGRPFSYKGNYPNGWCAMQLMAAYREAPRPTGLYFAVHDPFGSTKDLSVESDLATHSVRFGYDIPAPNMGSAGNDFRLSGEAVWQLLRGDWFDAATIYKTWARGRANWWPRLTADGRADTPLWMRELSAWTIDDGTGPELLAREKWFRETMGVPVGMHWYNWHRIPFDNDYPHYFPTKPGFTEGVGALKDAGLFVMPYINGRLWDTRDRGADDAEFTTRALPHATKNDAGQPITEQYGSKEGDGSPVKLAVMCPATPFWQKTMRDTVVRLTEEQGVNGVYLDQIAAAAPALCMDAAHGHPLGGGHWWNESYGRMLSGIRRAMPRDRMLTSECNAEPFLRWFDGYLTWHWQFDGQVPVFPAVYGGAIQMFGRAYRGGPTKDLALRMKAGQQLVFGEQIGWLNPDAAREPPQNADFLRRVVGLRHRLRRYFYAGEMARPPKLAGPVPTVTADWQWEGVWPVTTAAVLTGAWSQPKARKLVLLFVNAGDQPVTAAVNFDARRYGISAKRLSATRIDAEGQARAESLPARFERRLTFPPQRALALELQW